VIILLKIQFIVAKKIANYKFILSVLCWYDILQRINIVLKSLQSHQINILQCLSLIKNVTGFLRDYRENVFINIEINAKDLAAQMNVSPEFPSVLQFRLKKRTQFSSQEFIDAKQKFKAEFFNYIIDVALNSLEKRFDQFNNHSYAFKFLYDVNTSDINDATLNQCKTLEIKLYNKNTNCSDINAIELFNEINLYKTTFSNEQQNILLSPIDILNKIAKNGFLEIFPNLTIVFRILYLD